jgi:glycosyltransferase involved in cell wall biosynthesis
VTSSPILRANDQVLEVSNRDLGASRNSGVVVARGRYVGVFDGDDYYTKNWLIQALAVVESKQGDVIVHPEYVINFGTFQTFTDLWDMDDRRDYSLANCLALHPWVSCSFGRKDLYLQHPYQRSDFIKTGFGYEDWHWNLELVSQGIRHVTAKKTALFYRRKSVSMLTGMEAAGVVIRPSEFFNRPVQWEKPSEGTPQLAEQVEIDDKTYIEELLKGKAWLESQWIALQSALIEKEAYLTDVLSTKDWLESQLRDLLARQKRLQSALPVRILKENGMITDD